MSLCHQKPIVVNSTLLVSLKNKCHFVTFVEKGKENHILTRLTMYQLLHIAVIKQTHIM